MQIRSNSLTDDNKNSFGLSQCSSSLAFSRLESLSPLVNSVPAPAIAPTTTTLTKPPQNRYEAIFIKLFAHTTIKLILSFAAIFFALVFLRDLIGFRINVFKISFWFQFTLNLALLTALIFAKLKCISNLKSSTYLNPFEKYFNQDQLILIGIWTAAAFNLGSWYLRQFAPNLYRLFDHVKGKNAPFLREEYFLLWATLLVHGLLCWISSIVVCVSSSSVIIPKSTDKISLSRYLHCRIQQVDFWPSLMIKSLMIFVSFLIVHIFVAWAAFPIFGVFISCLIELNHPIRHSWTSLFRFGIFVNLFTFSIFSQLIFSLIDWLIEFYLNKTFKTCSLVPDSERCLTIGLCHTKQPFIHLQACNEFYDICTDSDSNSMSSFMRFKLFSTVEDEGSLSREICDWFVSEMNLIKERSDVSLKELQTFSSIVLRASGVVVINESTASSNNNNDPTSSIDKMLYSEKTVGLVELILKKVFSASSGVASTVVVPALNSQSGVPEIFARRGGNLKNINEENDLNKTVEESIPLMYEFGPFLFKNSFGRILISHWISSRKLFPLEREETLEICIKAMAAFIRASFVEDERGQIQICLPKLLESMMGAYEALQDLLKFNFSNLSFVKDEQALDSMVSLLRHELKGIRDTFGETLQELRLSAKCLNFLQTL